MIRRPPRSTRTDTLFPYTTLFRSTCRFGVFPVCSLVKDFVMDDQLKPFGSDWSRSEEHTSELQSLMRISYAVFCLKKKKTKYKHNINEIRINKHRMSNKNETIKVYEYK